MLYRFFSYLFCFFLVLLQFNACPYVAVAQTEGTGCTVLIYHRFGEDKYPTTNVSLERFREQLIFLRDNDYKVIPLAEMLAKMRRNEIPDHSVVITIDDSYKSVYQAAWPLLKSFAYPFTVFVYVEATDKNYPDYMTWEQIREMQAAGVDFQDHGYAHLHLAECPAGMDEQTCRSWISIDLAQGTRIMARELGERSRFLALPYGEYNSFVLNEAQNMGYEAVLTQDPGSVGAETDFFQIPREPILGNEWSTMAHFKEVLARVDLPLTEMSPGFIPLTSGDVKQFSTRITFPERYVSGSMGIFVSELGWQQGVLEGAVLRVKAEKKLTRQYDRVFVSGREKESGRMAIRSWLISLTLQNEN